ncbi:MAG: universal stress protein [Gemmatimonadales bacterium]|nr:universal stress protein [Gemmatimonadales bacterium]
MFRSILVPLDGSPFAERALDVAARLARRDHAALTLVRVAPAEVLALGAGGVPPIDPTLDRAQRAEAEAYLDDVATRLRESEAVAAVTVVRTGPIIDELVAIAADVRPDLVVMTSHGRSGLVRAWMGSTADELIRALDVPTLVLRQPDTPQPAGSLRFERVLVAVDGSDFADLAIEPALGLVERPGGRLTLLRVVLPESHLGAFPSEAWSEAATSRMQQATAANVLEQRAERIAARGIAVDSHVIAHEHPATAILEFAGQHGCDAIALATHGSSGFARLVFGSVADRLLRASVRPLLIVHPIPAPVREVASPAGAAAAALRLAGVTPLPA